jgi:hypothetical protein
VLSPQWLPSFGIKQELGAPIIPATQEAEVRRIKVRNQPEQIVHETLSGKNLHKRLAEWFKVCALSSNPSTAKKKKICQALLSDSASSSSHAACIPTVVLFHSPQHMSHQNRIAPNPQLCKNHASVPAQSSGHDRCPVKVHGVIEQIPQTESKHGAFQTGQTADAAGRAQ